MATIVVKRKQPKIRWRTCADKSRILYSGTKKVLQIYKQVPRSWCAFVFGESGSVVATNAEVFPRKYQAVRWAVKKQMNFTCYNDLHSVQLSNFGKPCILMQGFF